MRCAQCGLEQADGSTHCAQCGSLMAPPIKIGGLDAPVPVRKSPARSEAPPVREASPSETPTGLSPAQLAAGVLLGSLAIGWLVSSGLQTVGRWMEPAPPSRQEATVQALPLEEVAPVEVAPEDLPAEYLPEARPELVGPPAPDSSSFTEEELRQRRLEALRQIPPELRAHLGELPKDREVHFVLNEPQETQTGSATGSTSSAPATTSKAQSPANCNLACSDIEGGGYAQQNCLNNCLLGIVRHRSGVDASISATGCESVCGALRNGDILIYTTCIADCLSGGKGGGPD